MHRTIHANTAISRDHQPIGASRPIEPDALRLAAPGASLSPSIISGLVGLADGLSVIGTGLVIFLIHVGWGSETSHLYFSAVAIATVLTIAAFSATDMYKFERITHTIDGLKWIVLVCGLTFLILVALAFATKISEQYSHFPNLKW